MTASSHLSAGDTTRKKKKEEKGGEAAKPKQRIKPIEVCSLERRDGGVINRLR